MSISFYLVKTSPGTIYVRVERGRGRKLQDKVETSYNSFYSVTELSKAVSMWQHIISEVHVF